MRAEIHLPHPRPKRIVFETPRKGSLSDPCFCAYVDGHGHLCLHLKSGLIVTYELSEVVEDDLGNDL
jgi:hypothetical protein